MGGARVRVAGSLLNKVFRRQAFAEPLSATDATLGPTSTLLTTSTHHLSYLQQAKEGFTVIDGEVETMEHRVAPVWLVASTELKVGLAYSAQARAF